MRYFCVRRRGRGLRWLVIVVTVGIVAGVCFCFGFSFLFFQNGDFVHKFFFFLGSQFPFYWFQEVRQTMDQVAVLEAQIAPADILNHFDFQSVHFAQGQQSVRVSCPVLVHWRRIICVLGSQKHCTQKDSVVGGGHAH